MTMNSSKAIQASNTFGTYLVIAINIVIADLWDWNLQSNMAVTTGIPKAGALAYKSPLTHSQSLTYLETTVGALSSQLRFFQERWLTVSILLS